MGDGPWGLNGHESTDGRNFNEPPKTHLTGKATRLILVTGVEYCWEGKGLKKAFTSENSLSKEINGRFSLSGTNNAME